jgi:hypothetical protein
MLEYTKDDDVPEDNTIKKRKISKKDKNKNYVRLVLCNYENNDLDSFFGKMIVKFFDKENPEDRQIWTADMSRLSLIIMQVVNKKGEKEWHHDKSGKKFIDLVIDPMFKVVCLLIDEFIKNVNQTKPKVPKNGKPLKPFELPETMMRYVQLASELKQDIKYHKFEKDILRFVAPYFNFDTIRMSEERKLLTYDEPEYNTEYDYSDESFDEELTIKRKVQKKSK